jgi:glyoxylase-like metal-dependent hydrolase (beta-lactamase superfamily II)
MIETIFPDLFRIEIPLPDSPLKSINAYLIKGRDRHLLIDTGFDRKECLDAMNAALAELNIATDRIDLFITHLHADHMGMVPELVRNGTKVFFNRPDAEILWGWEGFDPMLAYALQNGYTENGLRETLESHPSAKFEPSQLPELTIIENGHLLTVTGGRYRFECVVTPGHTRGHTCLYEPEKKIFISGDHILGDITPHIQCWRDEWNPLQDYLESLDRVRALDVDLVLPGHRGVFHNFRRRIDELKAHHRERADEIVAVLENGPKTAFQIAPKLSWDISCKSWEDFPTLQKWFAAGETIAHLKYLYGSGEISRNTAGEFIVYSITNR